MFDELADQVNLKLVYSQKIPTIIKRKYLTRNEKRDEYTKIFATNNIPEKPGFESDTRNRFIEKLNDSIEEYDVVFM